MMKELRLEIFGIVQGVGFRDAVRRFAQENGLHGFVRNRNDGSVLLVAQGEKKKLHKLLHLIQSNPGMPGLSQVSGMSYYWQEPRWEKKEFEIIREKNFIKDQLGAFTNLGRKLLRKEKKIGRMPGHVIIIPDGNRRWAREKGLVASSGHYKASNYYNIKSLFNEARKLGIKYMTLWGFSTENWNRDKREIEAIFEVIMKSVDRFRKDAHKDKIRFRHLGRKDRLPRKLVSELEKLENETKNYSDFNVQLCLDYGGRDEIVRAVNKLIESGKKVSENDFANALDSAGIPEPDLIIRTSGERRVSGMMPFQSAYAELYFTDVYFPDFDAFEFRKAVLDYGNRIRRFGGTAKEDLK